MSSGSSNGLISSRNVLGLVFESDPMPSLAVTCALDAESGASAASWPREIALDLSFLASVASL
jgi:hypothetical protein